MLSRIHRQKAVVSILLCGILLFAGVSFAACTQTTPTPSNLGWYWKPPYPNYAPHTPGGMPDFDQKQDQWKKITAGPNGIIDSAVAGDDVLNVAENCIAPGPNAHLDSAVAGDDVAKWCYCGPAAVANCLWWYDSKFEDPNGTAGDGQNEFDLVKDYGAGDDHAKANAPLLIQKLAVAMQTTNKGTTYVSDMQTGLANWFSTYGLSSMFVEHTYNNPTFANVCGNVTASQDVILLLTDYVYNQGGLLIDQQMPVVQSSNHALGTITWMDYQSFVPSVTRLDAIEICLVSNSYVPCDVTINLYNAGPPSAPIATTTINPGYLAAPTWVLFPFPAVPLIAGSTYYIGVTQSLPDFHYEWFYVQSGGDPYPPGQGWIDGAPGPTYFDWTFKTEYYNPSIEESEGHFVTCAGVNQQGNQIAFSDPDANVATPGATDHNDAKNVSHDTYSVVIGSPDPGINCTWYITGYPGTGTYTVVTSAIVVCSTKTLNPNLDTAGTLTWPSVKKGATVTGTFTVSNIGDANSRLDWKVLEWPTWGVWSFSPANGDNLKPADGAKTITATVIAPASFAMNGGSYSGTVKVVNAEDHSDFGTITVSMTTPLGIPSIWERLCARFPLLAYLFHWDD